MSLLPVLPPFAKIQTQWPESKMKRLNAMKLCSPLYIEILLAVTVISHWWLGLPVPAEAHQSLKWVLMRLSGRRKTESRKREGKRLPPSRGQLGKHNLPSRGQNNKSSAATRF